jgi:hypothetical protein
MAEGLDEAQSAFANAISPASPPRPRDTSGRFASTRAQPEPMFEPRPVEGDPLTGDTRDGGDDRRLSAREREIADGRIDERAERAAAQDRKDAVRNAAKPAGDDESADAQPERVGAEAADGEDPEGGDGKPEAEAESGDAEGEPEPDASAKYEVTVDGQTMEVSLDEALKGYIREQTFHQRMNKVAEARQAVEAEAGHIVQARDYYVQKIAYIDRLMQELTPQPPDWDKEYAADPAAARQKQKAYEAIYQRQAWLNAEIQRTQAEASAEYERNAQRYAHEQFSSFVLEAKIPDEKALNQEMSAMRSYAKMRGFSEGEIATVYDKRMLQVLRDATKHHQSMAARPKAVMPGKGKALTPGAATPVGNAGRRNIDDAQRQLAKSGRLDDAAVVFQRLLR